MTLTAFNQRRTELEDPEKYVMGPARAAVDTKDTNDIRVPWRLIKQPDPNRHSNRRRSMEPMNQDS